MLAIWTKEDDEAGRTNTSLDTPSVSSVVGSNEEDTGGEIAGDVPSVDGELTPEINHPDVPANATSSSPAQRQAPAHAFHKRIVRVKLRSSMSRREILHFSNSDTKVRSTAFPAPTPLLMNAGTSLYNSDYTQPFKNAKKAPAP